MKVTYVATSLKYNYKRDDTLVSYVTAKDFPLTSRDWIGLYKGKGESCHQCYLLFIWIL